MEECSVVVPKHTQEQLLWPLLHARSRRMPLGSKWKARSYWSNYYEPLGPKRTGETTVHIGGGLALYMWAMALYNRPSAGLVLATVTALRMANATAGGAPGALPRQVAEKVHSLSSSAIRRLCSLQHLGFLPGLVKICCIVGEHLQVRPTFYGQYCHLNIWNERQWSNLLCQWPGTTCP